MTSTALNAKIESDLASRQHSHRQQKQVYQQAKDKKKEHQQDILERANRPAPLNLTYSSDNLEGKVSDVVLKIIQTLENCPTTTTPDTAHFLTDLELAVKVKESTDNLVTSAGLVTQPALDAINSQIQELQDYMVECPPTANANIYMAKLIMDTPDIGKAVAEARSANQALGVLLYAQESNIVLGSRSTTKLNALAFAEQTTDLEDLAYSKLVIESNLNSYYKKINYTPDRIPKTAT